MSLYLVVGNYTAALEECSYLVSFLCLVYRRIPLHPLLGLQLFTLGDLLHATGDEEKAMKIYSWSKEILKSTHGAKSDLSIRLDSLLGNQLV